MHTLKSRNDMSQGM